MPGRHIAPRHRATRPREGVFGRSGGAAGGRGTRAKSGLRHSAAVLGAAGVALGVGVVTVHGAPATHAAATRPHAHTHTSTATSGALLAIHMQRQGEQVSRSAFRPPHAAVQRATKSAALPLSSQAVSGGVTKSVAPTDPRAIAAGLMPSYGWDSGQFSCLDDLYLHESAWDYRATNPFSGAYGIPQALPASKMATYGSDWATNPATQLKWGLWYIRMSYGTPCGAWAFWQAHHWY